MAFLRATIAAVRRQVGDDYPVWAKLGVAGAAAHGLTKEMGARVAHACAQMDVECVEISHALGIPEGLDAAHGADTGLAECIYLPMAEAARQAVGPTQPLALVAGFSRSAVMEQVLASGVVQMVSLCRPLIADPALPRHLRERRLRKAHCTRCDRCRLNMETEGIACRNASVQRRVLALDPARDA